MFYFYFFIKRWPQLCMVYNIINEAGVFIIEQK